MIKLIKSTFFEEAETKKALAHFILEESILSMGKECAKFEVSFAKQQQRKYAVYVANGSVANFLLIQSLLNLGILRKDSRVGFSALTWPTNVMPLIQLGLSPIAIDCELGSLNISPKQLRKHVEGLDALFLTNVLGFCDNISEIKKICSEKKILLIEDNCESLGSRTDGTLLGNFGLASTFSFFVGHHMSTIEGGMICTDNKELYESMIMSRAHGWDRNLDQSTKKRLQKDAHVDDFYSKYTFYDLASNFRPTEIGGFIGNTQLPYLEKIIETREGNFKQFQNAMKSNDDFFQYDLSHMETVSNFAMPIICKTANLANKYREKFTDNGVEIRPIIAGNMVNQPFYKKYVINTAKQPNSELVHANGFYFGNNPEMTNEEISILTNLLKNGVK